MGYPFSRNRWLKGFKGSQLFVSFTISCVSATSSAVRASKMKSCSNFIIGQAVRVRTLDGKEHTAIQCATARAVRKGQGECETRYTGFFSFLFFFLPPGDSSLFSVGTRRVSMYDIYFLCIWIYDLFKNSILIWNSRFQTFHTQLRFSHAKTNLHLDLYTTMYTHTHAQAHSLA